MTAEPSCWQTSPSHLLAGCFVAWLSSFIASNPNFVVQLVLADGRPSKQPLDAVPPWHEGC